MTRRLTGLLVILCFVLGALALQAEVIPEDEVRRAAETYARTVSRDARPDAYVTHMEPYKAEGEVVAYIAHLDGGGYCLCAADDLLLPVYLYAPSGTYDPANPSAECILREIAERTDIYRSWVAEGGSELQERRQEMSERSFIWKDLAAGRLPASVIEKRSRTRIPEEEYEMLADPDIMELPLTSSWHQFHPYYDQCPTHPQGGDHCLVGCPATAMAQIMYYWQWPYTGQGDHMILYVYRYRTIGDWDEEPLATDPEITDLPGWTWADRLEWVPTDGGKLRMTGYWDVSVKAAAEDTAFIHNKTPAYQTALDALYNRLTQAGDVCYADFGSAHYNWSVIQDIHTDPPDAGDAEVAEINYHVAVAINTVFGVRGSSSSGPEIANAIPNYFYYDPDAVTVPANSFTIVEEIQWMRCIVLGGCGHAWVVLGYDKITGPTWLFLRNMGWGGDGNGWYTVDDWCIIPWMEHVINIAPISVRFVGNVASGDGSPDNPYYHINEALASAPDGSTLIFKAGTQHTYIGGDLVIDRPLTLMGEDVRINAVPVR
jgi:hypothetical protein